MIEASQEKVETVKDEPPDKARICSMFTTHFDFVWRSVRRLGVCQADADDAAQRVFIIASEKMNLIEHGSERAFLFGTCVRVASHVRRSYRQRSELDDEKLDTFSHPGPPTDILSDIRGARELVDLVLDDMPLDLRAVLVLCELEEMTLPEVAILLDLPLGTATSRLRRAREDFEARVKRTQARWEAKGRAR